MSDDRSEPAAAGAVESACYAYMDEDGIEISSIAYTPLGVRNLMLKESMGWRFEHPERYNRNEAWERLCETGRVVRVRISVVSDHVA